MDNIEREIKEVETSIKSYNKIYSDLEDRLVKVFSELQTKNEETSEESQKYMTNFQESTLY